MVSERIVEAVAVANPPLIDSVTEFADVDPVNAKRQPAMATAVKDLVFRLNDDSISSPPVCSEGVAAHARAASGRTLIALTQEVGGWAQKWRGYVVTKSGMCRRISRKNDVRQLRAFEVHCPAPQDAGYYWALYAVGQPSGWHGNWTSLLPIWKTFNVEMTGCWVCRFPAKHTSSCCHL